VEANGKQYIGTGLRVPQATAAMGVSGSYGKLAKQFGVSVRQIRTAIEKVKQDGFPRGGPVRNTNVVVDEQGESYPLGPRGVPAEDSIGNVFDYMDSEGW
jgi:hypothetical protein